MSRNQEPPSAGSTFIDRYATAFANATRVFGSAERAEEWLFESNIFLDGDAPVTRLRTDEDAGLIGNLLVQIEYGTYT